MRAAVIDLGTNTFHLIIADVFFNDINILYKTNVPVKLGEGRINENIIISEAFERGISTLVTFKREIEKWKVEKAMAIATSAIRSAANGLDFINSARSIAGIEIRAISGDDEAEYVYKGVKATGIIDGPSLIMDIGGGSTEFIICGTNGLHWKKSYNIGAARLMQAYFRSDPISIQDQNEIKTALDDELIDLVATFKDFKPTHLIGSAGAFETFAAMISDNIDIQNIRFTPIAVSAFKKLSEELIASSHEERKKMPDLIKLRVDMIVIAAILTDYILSKSGIERLSLSTYDLKMGVLYSLQ